MAAISFAPMGQEEKERILLPRVPRRPERRRSTRGYNPSPRRGEAGQDQGLTMTRRFIIYIAVFDLLAAAAALPGLVAEVMGGGLPKLLFRILGPVAAPPMMVIAYAYGAVLPLLRPQSKLSTTSIVRAIICCCALYYGFLFVVLLPVGLPRGPGRGLPTGLQKPWRVLASVVVIAHLLLATRGMIRWWAG